MAAQGQAMASQNDELVKCAYTARGVRERTRETSHFTSNGLRKSANIVLLNDASLRARERRVPRCPTSRFSSLHLPDSDDSERRRAQVTRRRRPPRFVVSVSRQNHELSLTRFSPASRRPRTQASRTSARSARKSTSRSPMRRTRSPRSRAI